MKKNTTGRLDMNKIGMSGHSFGAVTTQAVSGQGLARHRRAEVRARKRGPLAK
jgi:predicted dienelactone hydrolase